ncbi:MAG TPA: hypothetical protein VEA44_04210 [Caulobacter sp.]|nr:hypothetical protein [Caulobacter sp.]
MRLGKLAVRAAAVGLLATPLAAGAEGAWKMGSVAVLPSQTAASAAVFHRYMEDAAKLDGQFRNADGVAAAVKRAAAYDSVQMQQGMVVYAAFVALQDEAYVTSVRDMEARYGRAAMLDLMARDPAGVVRLQGAHTAGLAVTGALRAEGDGVLASGRSVKQASYDLQRQPWSKGPVRNPAARLAEAKALGQARAPSEAETARLIEVVHRRPVAAFEGRYVQRFSPVVEKGLGLAALLVLGESLEAPQAQALMADGRSAGCLRMAKLNFHQCLSVAGPHYEDVYCVGQHALLDTGTCVSSAAGGL